jgi:hypothetical protein
VAISKEILDITLILLPGLIAFIIAESLIPYSKAEFKRSVAYVIILSAISFFIAIIFWKLYYKLGLLLAFKYNVSNLELTNIFSFKENIYFTFLVFVISIALGIFFAWAINKHIIYKLMSKLGGSSMTSNMEVWDDFFALKRENSFVVVRDIKNNLMYYGSVNYYSIATTSQMIALHLNNVDVFDNESSVKLYNVKELYLPFQPENMTVEFPNN